MCLLFAILLGARELACIKARRKDNGVFCADGCAFSAACAFARGDDAASGGFLEVDDLRFRTDFEAIAAARAAALDEDGLDDADVAHDGPKGSERTEMTAPAALHQKGVKGKILGAVTGIGKLYGGVNLLSDVLSYSRLFGLSLSGSVVALVVNQICTTLMDLLPSIGGLPVIGVIIAGIVWLFYRLTDKQVQVMADYNMGRISREDADAGLAALKFKK